MLKFTVQPLFLTMKGNGDDSILSTIYYYFGNSAILRLAVTQTPNLRLRSCGASGCWGLENKYNIENLAVDTSTSMNTGGVIAPVVIESYSNDASTYVLKVQPPEPSKAVAMLIPVRRVAVSRSTSADRALKYSPRSPPALVVPSSIRKRGCH